MTVMEVEMLTNRREREALKLNEIPAVQGRLNSTACENKRFEFNKACLVASFCR